MVRSAYTKEIVIFRYFLSLLFLSNFLTSDAQTALRGTGMSGATSSLRRYALCSSILGLRCRKASGLTDF
jgi:hypothetical protein